MEYMRTLPDKAFDLAVVDPPYGGGCSQSVKAERESRGCAAEPQTMRAGAGHASAGFLTNTTSTRRQRRRGRTSLRIRLPRSKRALPARAAHGLSSIKPRADMSATSGIGMSPRRRNTLRSLPASARDKSSGAAITSTCRRRAALSCGASSTSRWRASQCRRSSTRGRR